MIVQKKWFAILMLVICMAMLSGCEISFNREAFDQVVEEEKNKAKESVENKFFYHIAYEENCDCDFEDCYCVGEMPDATKRLQALSGIKMKISKKNPIRTGYHFDGWMESPEASTTIEAGERIEIKGDITLYAKWIQSDTAHNDKDIQIDGDYLYCECGARVTNLSLDEIAEEKYGKTYAKCKRPGFLNKTDQKREVVRLYILNNANGIDRSKFAEDQGLNGLMDCYIQIADLMQEEDYSEKIDKSLETVKNAYAVCTMLELISESEMDNEAYMWINPIKEDVGRISDLMQIGSSMVYLYEMVNGDPEDPSALCSNFINSIQSLTSFLPFNSVIYEQLLNVAESGLAELVPVLEEEKFVLEGPLAEYSKNAEQASIFDESGWCKIASRNWPNDKDNPKVALTISEMAGEECMKTLIEYHQTHRLTEEEANIIQRYINMRLRYELEKAGEEREE